MEKKNLFPYSSNHTAQINKLSKLFFNFFITLDQILCRKKIPSNFLYKLTLVEKHHIFIRKQRESTTYMY